MRKLEGFELWWAGFWKKSAMPEVLDMAMKELAQSAWNASVIEESSERDELKEAKRELLEMLEAVIFIADNKMATRSEMNQAIANARAAIAKHSKGE